MNTIDSQAALERRIKRHIIGRTLDFFTATSPGLEELCLNELKSLSPTIEEVYPERGGVRFKGRIHDCYLANLSLRTANRILMRIGEFRASNFGQLGKKLSSISWELYLKKGVVTTIEISSRHSRLYHGGAVSEHIEKSISECFKRISSRPEYSNTYPSPQKLFVRITDNRFLISVDSSGELLYKRGIKRHGGKAPIRETLATAALLLAGFDPAEPLIDPMCGTGTFSLEAAMICRNIPPGWHRKFAFMGWPSFKETRWKHIRREAKKEITGTCDTLILASDRDKNTCGKLEDAVNKSGLSGIVRVINQDFFTFSPLDFTNRTGLVILNPPYGQRLETKKKSRELYEKIFQRLIQDYKGWKVALFVPDNILAGKMMLGLDSCNLNHGGVRLRLFTGRIRQPS